MQPDIEPSEEPREHLERVLEFLRRAYRFKQVALTVLLVGELVCVAYLLLRTPRYRSQTVLLYSEGVRTTEVSESAAPPKSLAVRMQEMLTSRRQLQSLVEEFDLYPDERSTFGMTGAVDALKEHIEFRAPGGDTFTIAFEGVTPEQTFKVTERLGKLVIDQDVELRRKQTLSTRDFLAGEKQRADKLLKAAEQNLAGFMAEHPRFALDAMPLATGAAIRASVPDPTGADAQLAARSASGSRFVRVPAYGAKATESAASSAAKVAPTEAQLARVREAEAESARAKAALAAARENLNDKRSRYTDAHPDVQAAREAVARAQARAEAAYLKTPVLPSGPAKVTSTVPTPAPARAARRYVSVPAPKGAPKTAAPETTTEELVALETDWSRLTRAVTEARQRHDQVEAALFKADIASSSATGGLGTRVTVIDPAFLPQQQVPPGPRTLAALFFVLSIFAAIGSALLCALLDDRIHDARSVEGLVDVLVEVPRTPKPRRLRA